MTSVEIRTLDPGDVDQIADLGAHSFGGPRRVVAAEDRPIPHDDVVAAYLGPRLVGTVSVHRFTQTFGGRGLPCGGVAGVMVAPDQRGAGLARRMVAAATEAMRARGEVISALYPTTATLYRSVGYEIAGWWGRRAIGVGDLPRPSGDVDWEPIDPSHPAVASIAAAAAADRDGWVLPSDRFWRWWAGRRTAEGTTTWTWLGTRGGEPAAVVSYSHGESERRMFDLDADVVLGVDTPAFADALAFLGANGTTGDRLRTTVPTTLLARIVPDGSRIATLEDWPWMLRLLDLPGAVAARGWPAGVTLEVDLRVAPPRHVPDDPVGGDWVLRVADGSASCTPGGTGAVGVASTDLAAVFSGHLDPAHLASEGRLTGAAPDVVSALRAACAGSPSLPMFF